MTSRYLEPLMNSLVWITGPSRAHMVIRNMLMRVSGVAAGRQTRVLLCARCVHAVCTPGTDKCWQVLFQSATLI